ncbi:MAG: patatin-like phospholipase family protein [Deltaproteobacteria bacterium]|nr:patatin-like phospholipase family protein [Deltaproteobacteria bacterium]
MLAKFIAASLLVWLALGGAALPGWAEAPRPKVGLALSGGGARGLAHIGVLKIMEKIGVPVDYVAGTSMGSIIGGLYAAGYTPDQMAEIVGKVNWTEAFSSTPARELLRYDQKNESRYLLEVGLARTGVLLPSGVLSGYKLTALLNSYVLPVAKIRDFDDLPIPYRAVATDIVTGEKVVLAKGNLALAMRASMSIPSLFAPFELDNRLLVDGGMAQNLPVQTVQEMGAEVVIAVNVSTPLYTRKQLKNFFQVLDQSLSLQIIRSTNEQAKLANLVITPELEAYTSGDFDKAGPISQAGLEAAEKAEADIRRLCRQHDIPLKPYQRAGVTPPLALTVQKVSLEGPAGYSQDLKRMMHFEPGQKITVAELDRTVQRIYGLGTVAAVNYDVLPLPGGETEVRFRVIPKDLGEVAGRMGLTLEVATQSAGRANVFFNFRREDFLVEDSRTDLDLALGRLSGIGLKSILFNRPWDDFFLSPAVFLAHRYREIYQDQDILAEYTQTTLGLKLGAGSYLGNFGETSLSYLLMADTLNKNIGELDIGENDSVSGGLDLFLGLDSLDRAWFPSSGISTSLRYWQMLRELGSTVSYQRLWWEGIWPYALAEKHVLELNWSAATSFFSNPPLSQTMFIGGINGMWGYGFDELHGMDYVRAQLLYRWKLSQMLIWELGLNAGNAWDDLNLAETMDYRLLWGGGTGLGVDTPLGPIRVILGVGEQGRLAAYLTFGSGF